VELTLEAKDLTKLSWWIDASYGVHHDMRSHTGAVCMAGKGAIYAMSSRQKLNTRSSTEAELVGVNDAMSMVLWIRKFIEAQGYTINDNVIFQDNMSAMLLKKNGKRSSGKQTRHIDIRYYFITDNTNRGTVRVAYCPTDDMIADFFTKPLQGSKFYKFRSKIMNCPGPGSWSDQPQECVGADTKSVRMAGPDRPSPVQSYADVYVPGVPLT